MKILITGSGGLLGSSLVRLAVSRHVVYSAYNEHPHNAGIPIKVDITDFDAVKRKIVDIRPEVIIHAAALTDVDRCERDKELALKLNHQATANIVHEAERIGAFLIYISTDYVFDGHKGLYREEDPPKPVNFYGHSKLKGEEVVEKLAGNFCIVRPSATYGSSPPSGKANFALWLLQKLEQNEPINVLADQFVSPTLNTSLAEASLEVAMKTLTGIYHFAGAERVSRYDFALRLCTVFGFDPSLIRSARMDELNWVATRPKDSSLDVSKSAEVLNTKPLKLDEALLRLKNEISG